jgi:hypothetical protein
MEPAHRYAGPWMRPIGNAGAPFANNHSKPAMAQTAETLSVSYCDDPLAVQVTELDTLPDTLAARLEGAERQADHVAMAPSFLRAYLARPPEGVKPGLLVAETADGSTLGVAAFARFDIHIDCLAPMKVQRVAALIRRYVPRFLHTRVVLFGLPDGLGGFDTVVLGHGDAAARNAVRHALLDRSELIAAREGATGLIWKELDQALLADWNTLLDARAFIREPSVPTVVQQLTFAGVGDYEAKLRSNYRHQLRANVEHAARVGLTIELAQPFAPHVRGWYPLFFQVLEHSETRLETLGRHFFEELARDRRYVLNTAVLDGQLVGGALCIIDRGTLYFLFIGMDYAAARGCDLYFNLLYSVLRLGIESGCHTIHWGQTSLDAKGRFGGIAQPLWFFLKFRSRWLGRFVRMSSGLFFPPRPQTQRHVLQSPAPGHRNVET